MIRALLIFLLLVIAASAAAWLADHPGRVTIVWQTYRVDTSFAVLAAGAALIALAAGLLVRLVGSVVNALRLSRRARAERRRRRGYRALTQGMVAVAAGDADEAARQARRADVLLAEPPLTMLLSAQAAQLNGDAAAARKYFTAMLGRPETAFLGLRGLLTQALREGDAGTAMALARRAYKLRPRTPWVVRTLFHLQARDGQWDAAAGTLGAAVRHKVVPGDEGRRAQAVALYGQSLQAEAQALPSEALALMRKAHRLAPGLVPVTVRLAQLFAADGQERRAHKLIEQAWKDGPHPDLARAYAELKPEETPLERVRRFEKLVESNPDHEESRIALADVSLAAKLWGEARRHLGAALEMAPAAMRRVCRLMAELEENERGNGEAAQQWLSRAAEAGPDPAWVCERCGTPTAAWTPLCRHCEAFDSLAWGSPVRIGIGAIASAGAPAALAPNGAPADLLARRPLAGPPGGGVDATGTRE